MIKRYLGRGLGAALAIIVIGIAAIPWSLSAPAVRQQLGQQLLQATGLDMVAAGRVTFSVLPRPRLKLDKVTLERSTAGAAGPGLVIEAKNIRSDLHILPLLIGRIEVADVELRQPIISLNPDVLAADIPPAITQNSRVNTQNTALELPIDPSQFGLIQIESGTIRWAASQFGAASQLDRVQLRFEWHGIERPAAFNGNAVWNGHKIDLSAWLGTPSALLAGSASPISLKLTSDLMTLNADGTASGNPAIAFDGKLAATTTDLSALLQMMPGNQLIPALPLKANLKAKASITRRATDMSDLQFGLGGSEFEGSLAIRKGVDRPLISATLATDKMNVTPLVTKFQTLFSSDTAEGGADLRRQFDLVDLDLRVSAARVDAGQVRLDDAALGAIMNNGRVEVSIADAKAFGGSLKMRVSSTSADARERVRASGAFNDIDVKSALKAGGLGERMSGAATGQFTLESTGSTINDILANLSGQTKVHIVDGEIPGLDIEQALRRADKKASSGSIEPRAGRMGFTTADGTIDISDGNATLLDGTVNGPGAILALSGQFGLVDHQLNLNAIARQSGDRDGTGPKLRIDLQGLFENPLLSVERASTE